MPAQNKPQQGRPVWNGIFLSVVGMICNRIGFHGEFRGLALGQAIAGSTGLTLDGPTLSLLARWQHYHDKGRYRDWLALKGMDSDHPMIVQSQFMDAWKEQMKHIEASR